MTDLLLRQVAESGAGAEGQDNFDVIGPNGLVIGRIFKADVAPVGMPWMWTMLFDYRWPTHGYAASRVAAIAAFAKSWRRDNEKKAPETAPGD